MVWEETLRSDCCWDSGQETRRNERRTADEVVEIAGNGGERLTGIPVFLLFVSFSCRNCCFSHIIIFTFSFDFFSRSPRTAHTQFLIHFTLLIHALSANISVQITKLFTSLCLLAFKSFQFLVVLSLASVILSFIPIIPSGLFNI